MPLGGAWTNSSATRSILSPQANANPQGTALVHYPTPNAPGAGNLNGAARPDEEFGYERPPPKGHSELFNPKSGNRSGQTPPKQAERDQSDTKETAGGKARGEAVVLTEKLNSMTLDGPFGLQIAGAGEDVPPLSDVPAHMHSVADGAVVVSP